ncbi:hypothetical protein L838_4584 [Mycobacterium avium MAV_120709_2344]|nr:hypothetical protein L838_4584 [Mycobacterium avium MAV_120709_2344]
MKTGVPARAGVKVTVREKARRLCRAAETLDEGPPRSR